MTRSAVWKAVEALRELGVEIEAVTHRGYRLRHASAALDASAIRAALAPAARAGLRTLEVEWSLPSSNATLLARAAPPPGSCDVLLVEHQSAGRGPSRPQLARAARRQPRVLDRASFDPLPRELSSLSLAIGLCVRRALLERGAQGLALKWPNDLLAGGASSAAS